MSAAVDPWAPTPERPMTDAEAKAELASVRRAARRMSTKPPTYTSLDEAGRKAALSDEKRAVEAWMQKQVRRG